MWSAEVWLGNEEVENHKREAEEKAWMVASGTMFGSRDDLIFQDGRDSSKLMAKVKEP